MKGETCTAVRWTWVAMEIKELLDREYPRICCNTYGADGWWMMIKILVMKEEAITGRKSGARRYEELYLQQTRGSISSCSWRP